MTYKITAAQGTRKQTFENCAGYTIDDSRVLTIRFNDGRYMSINADRWDAVEAEPIATVANKE